MNWFDSEELLCGIVDIPDEQRNDGIRIRFAVACVGENGIQAGTPYYVNNNGEFIKISSNT